MNLQMGRVYMTNADPKTATRTWQEAMDELCSHGNPMGGQECKRGKIWALK
jgi:hypothetical protein